MRRTGLFFALMGIEKRKGPVAKRHRPNVLRNYAYREGDLYRNKRNHNRGKLLIAELAQKLRGSKSPS